MNNDSIEIKAKALRVAQRPRGAAPTAEFENLYEFFVLTLPSDKILSIARFLGRSESKYGVQREHLEDRDKQIGAFICSEHPFFPNTIIINMPMAFRREFYNEVTGELSVGVQKGSAYVIDGQHRLKAFLSKYSQGTTLPLVVTVYFGLELPTIAEIFTRINFFQKPVSKSLVYDLLQLNTDPEFQKYSIAHRICEALNKKAGSPFYGMIKMLGVGTGLLSQAAFVEAISTRYKIIPTLEGSLDVPHIQDVLERYFAAVKEAFPGKWGEPASILSRTVGFNALVKILREIIDKNGVFEAEQLDFQEHAAALATVDVDTDAVTSFGGFKGVNALAEMFHASLAEKDLV